MEILNFDPEKKYKAKCGCGFEPEELMYSTDYYCDKCSEGKIKESDKLIEDREIYGMCGKCKSYWPHIACGCGTCSRCGNRRNCKTGDSLSNIEKAFNFPFISVSSKQAPYNFFTKIDHKKFEEMKIFAKTARDYSKRGDWDDGEDWLIELFTFCKDFTEMFK